MKHHLYIFLILLIVLITSGCSDQTTSPASSLAKEENGRYGEAQTIPQRSRHDFLGIDTNDGDEETPKCVILPELPDWPTAYFVIEQVIIKNDIITFTISYSGGCRPHGFQLVSTGFQESHALQVLAEVFHNNNNDLCDQWVTEVREFDLSPLKELYFKMYDKPCGNIIIKLADFTTPDFGMLYQFCRERELGLTD